MSKPVKCSGPLPAALKARIHSTSASTSSVFQVQKYMPPIRAFGSPGPPWT